MEVVKVVVGPLATNSYIVCKNDECIVVDPGDGGEKLLRALGRRSLVSIVATHLHFDHVGAVAHLVEATGVPFYAHPADWRIYKELNEVAVEWGFEVPTLPQPRNPGSRLWLFDVLHTPGHTPGSISLLGGGVVFTGDTLFRMSVGRTDLPYGNWEELMRSVCRLYQLPSDFVVHPGHGPPTSIGDEATGNPFINSGVCDGGLQSNNY